MKYKIISTTISEEYYELLKKNNIKFAEALRVGASFLLSKQLNSYQTRIQIERDLSQHKEKLVFLLNEMLDLRMRLNEDEKKYKR